MAQASDATELDTMENTREFEQIEEDFQEVRCLCAEIDSPRSSAVDLQIMSAFAGA
jgi:hypothetical protein